MAVAIRMSRGGAKKRPYYKIVVADVRAPRDGKFIERIGSYNPLLAKDDEKRVVLDVERAKHWLEVGAKPSDRVARFLDAAGLMKREPRNNPQKGEPGEKAKERLEEKAAKDAAPAAEEAPAEEAPAEAPAEDAPADEAPAEEAATETPAKETAAEETPAEEAKAEEPAAEEKPAEETKEEAPAEETKQETADEAKAEDGADDKGGDEEKAEG